MHQERKPSRQTYPQPFGPQQPAGFVSIAQDFVPPEQMVDFTSRVAKMFKLTKGDFGSPVDDISQG
ncbi:MAG: hypothetical protein V4671_21785, partial [Armatimonadota bacterium]